MRRRLGHGRRWPLAERRRGALRPASWGRGRKAPQYGAGRLEQASSSAGSRDSEGHPTATSPSEDRNRVREEPKPQAGGLSEWPARDGRKAAHAEVDGHCWPHYDLGPRGLRRRF